MPRLASKNMLSTRARDIWFNPRSRGLFFQLIVLLSIASFLAFITANTIANLQKAGLTAGFEFLTNQAFFDINQRLISFSSQSSFGRALVVGLLNTVLVSSLGIIAATIIGFLAGILRLSKNWLVSRIVTTYVEITRNVPLLLQIIFWWATFTSLPRVRDSVEIFEVFFLNNRGLRGPSPIFELSFSWVLLTFLVGLVATFALALWSRRRQLETGRTFRVLPIGLLLIVVIPVLIFFGLNEPMVWEIPKRTRFNFTGGINITPELLALWVALATYTGAFISEIVRAGILSVSVGQTEAAQSLGLRNKQTMRLIILPQAFRVIIPPLTSQYLNLTKNSSLAIAIGYQDLVSIGGTILNQSGHALEIVAIWMAVYLSLSLATSAYMNWYNKRISLVER
jgi:general L-amino acid transport system permease protein